MSIATGMSILDRYKRIPAIEDAYKKHRKLKSKERLQSIQSLEDAIAKGHAQTSARLNKKKLQALREEEANKSKGTVYENDYIDFIKREFDS
eukprot:311441-Karenia_brevis.AAC.1